MSTKNNVACMAAQAEPCPNHVAIKAIQVMVRALRSVSNLNMQAADWSDFNTEIDHACALAIQHFKALAANKSARSEQFFSHWDMAVCVVRLMARACPAHQASLLQMLDEVVQLSMAQADKVEQAFAKTDGGINVA